MIVCWYGGIGRVRRGLRSAPLLPLTSRVRISRTVAIRGCRPLVQPRVFRMYGHLTDRACRVLLEMRSKAFPSRSRSHRHRAPAHCDRRSRRVYHWSGSSALRTHAERVRRDVQSLVTPNVDLDRGWTKIGDLGASRPDEETGRTRDASRFGCASNGIPRRD